MCLYYILSYIKHNFTNSFFIIQVDPSPTLPHTGRGTSRTVKRIEQVWVFKYRIHPDPLLPLDMNRWDDTQRLI